MLTFNMMCSVLAAFYYTSRCSACSVLSVASYLQVLDAQCRSVLEGQRLGSVQLEELNVAVMDVVVRDGLDPSEG
jgi:hypothetical protein